VKKIASLDDARQMHGDGAAGHKEQQRAATMVLLLRSQQ